jgi:AcrR family transcriptional regulator
MPVKKRNGNSTKLRIMDAAERAISKRGLSGATTKQIAEVAGCAEGTLYIHFRDQMHLFAALFERRLPMAADALKNLQVQAGKGNVVDNLVAALLSVGKFLEDIMPILAGALADPALGKAFRATWREFGFGPQNFVERVTTFIESEQQGRRIPHDTNAKVASEALVGFLFYSAFKLDLFKDRQEAAYQALLRDMVHAAIFGPTAHS